MLGRSNVYTYRSPGYMLSSVQDYHGGQTAGQQQAWQLTLDPSQVTVQQRSLQRLRLSVLLCVTFLISRPAWRKKRQRMGLL